MQLSDGAGPGQPSRAQRTRGSLACETCKRRKERCDGARPCGRCVQRGVDEQCVFLQRTRKTAKERRQSSAFPRTPYGQSDLFSAARLSDGEVVEQHQMPNDTVLSATASPTAGLQSRLIRDQKGRYMFIGDSANLSFLQVIRRIFDDCVGPCPFVDDPLRYLIVEASPAGQPEWMNASKQQEPPQIDSINAYNLIKQYLFATNGILDVFDESELLEHLEAWYAGRSANCTIPSPIYHLVLAIGAQTSTEDEDEQAEKLFTYGRYLTAQNFMEDASMLTVQSYALISMYLLGASRRNAAFMYLGIAVRAAYAIGLHRREVAASFSSQEFRARERLWKVLRMLDLFMSASMGRPPSTAETRDTEVSTRRCDLASYVSPRQQVLEPPRIP